MKIEKNSEDQFENIGSIVCAVLANSDEFVFITDQEKVMRYKKGGEIEHLFNTKHHEQMHYLGGGFDITSPISIYSLGSIIVVANDYMRHALMYNPNKSNLQRLIREDYHAGITCYPIAIFNDEKNIPHLIYSEAWNHLQIMNVDTLQVLTAAKSLIEEEDSEKMGLAIKLNIPWPKPYDYFYGELIVSPNGKQFLSKGWIWGSADCYSVYDIADFISNSRIKAKTVDYWSHSTRGACWIDDNTVAVVYSPVVEEDERAINDTFCELHIYSTLPDKPKIVNRIVLEGTLNLPKNLYYNQQLNSVITFSKENGLSVYTMQGRLILTDELLKPDSYYPEHGLFVTVNENSILTHKLVQ